MLLTLGSLFNGIGTWILSGEHAGIKTLWESEIDEFPEAVSHHHFPDVKQLGDVTKIDINEIEPVDIICAGSPCQDLSVAGKREGLEGERSGLFRTAIRLVHELRERTGKPRFFVWENVCFTEGTFVTTDKGLKEIQDVKEGDMVLTKSDEYCPVVKKHIHKDKETVVISACGTEPLTVTPNHPFWVRHNKHTQPRSFTAPEWIPAGQLKKDDWIGYKTDGYGIIRIGLPFAYAVGRWLADGSIVDRGEKRGSRGGQRFRIFISTGYKKYEHLKSKLSELPYKICENKMEHAINFTFTSDEFAKLIEQCGRGASNKKVPAWVYALSYEEQKELLQGYLDGDGHIRRGNEVSYCTTSRQLAYGMARLVRNVYHVGCSITKRKSNGKAIIEGRIVNAKDSYDCCFNIPSKEKTSNGSFYEYGIVWCKVKGVENGKREMVFNISVSGDNTFCANGIIVHNCGAFSSNKGYDFRAVLEEITKTEIPMPKDNKWADSGMVEWDGGSLAWRVLDAQGWGVPQRRRRIFLVADFGGKSAGEILFVEQGLPRDSAESERERKSTPTNARTGVDTPVYDVRISSDGTKNWRAHAYKATVSRALDTKAQNPDSNHGGLAIINHCLTPWDVQSAQVYDTKGKAPTLCAAHQRWSGLSPVIQDNKNTPIVFEPGIASRDGGHVYKGIAPTLRANPGDNAPAVFTLDRASFNQGRNAQYQFKIGQDGIADTLVAKGPGGGCSDTFSTNRRVVGCLCAGDYKGISNQYVADGKVVIDGVQNYRKSPER
jgi:site-specific DNA-cytosine methylase